MPLTTPEVDTVAIPDALVFHVPPDGEELRVVVDPTQSVAVPLMAVSSDTDELPRFHLSPASAPEIVFNAFTTPFRVTVPVPDDGAVHGMVIT